MDARMKPRDRLSVLAAASRRVERASVAPQADLSSARQARRRAAVGRTLDDITAVIRPVQAVIHRRVVRPDDLLALDLTFENMRMTRPGGAGRSGPARLTRRFASRPALMIVRLQGQAAGEQDFDEETPQGGPEPAPSLARARLAGPSRLVFRMPDDVQALDFSLEAVLEACRRWPMNLDGLARPDTIRVNPGLAAEANELVLAARPSAVVNASLRPLSEGVEALLAEAGERGTARRVVRAAKRAGAAGRKTRRRGPDPDLLFRRAVRGSKDDEEVVAAARVLFDAERTLIAARVADKGGRRARQSFEAVLLDIGPLVALLLRPHLPARGVTVIEAPYRLFMTPLAASAWAHALRPVEGGGRTELWHTRLASRVGGVADETDGRTQPLRYVWSHDYDPGGVADGYDGPGTGLDKTSPEPNERDAIVRLTAGYDEQRDGGGPYDPRSVAATEVMLSTLGAALDLEGSWSPRVDGIDVSAWRHVSNWGRDNYVRVVSEGFLLPIGHRAAIISVTERKFEDAPGGGRIALLRKREFIVARERVRRYAPSGMRDGGRAFPFAEAELLTRVTPPIARGSVGGGVPTQTDAFVPLRGGQDFLFDLRFTDMGGRSFATTSALTFIFASANAQGPRAEAVRAAFNSTAATARRRRTIEASGAVVQYAPETGGGADGADVALPTSRIRMLLDERVSGRSSAVPRALPRIEEADVIVPALKKLAPGGEVDQFRTALFNAQYLADAFGSGNPANLFLDLADALDLEFGAGRSSENAGGFFEPNMGVEALSALRGAVGDAAGAALGNFDPARYFGDAKLIGGLLIRDLLEGVVASIVGDDAPEFVSVDVGDPPTHAEARLTWNTEITRELPLFKPGAGGQTTVFDLNVKSKVPFDGTPPETTVQTTLSHFKVDMFGLIILWFDQLEFKKEPGKKADVNPDLHPADAVVFGGPLEFVNTLSNLIPDAGFSDPPVLDISPTGIVAGYELEIPDVSVGALLLTNMALGARLRLPFDGDPVSVRFNFAEREDPFNLTISLLGGGGFFALAVQSTGVREVEAAFEFGAAIAFDIGVASGGVYVKAGIYFHWLDDGGGETVELTGYVELGGELSVLGLIRVSVTFHLSLGYHKSGGVAELRGQATLTIEIEILFFSTSVKLKVERRFGGSPADPKFIDFIPDQPTWDRYAAAFA